MSQDLTRRDFVKTIGLAAGALGAWQLSGCSQGPATPPVRNMCGFAAPALERVRVGFIGLGMRGPGGHRRPSARAGSIRPGRPA